MARHKRHEDHEEHASEAWLVAFADMMTLLMVTFLMMFAISSLDLQKFKAFQEAFEAGLGKSLPAQAAAAKKPSDAKPVEGQALAAPAAPVVSSAPVVASATAGGKVVERKDAEDLQKRLQAAVAAVGLSSQVSVALDARGVVVYVTAGVLFDSGSATLLPDGVRLLGALAPVLAGVGNELDVEGHTDDRPISSAAFPSNWELSTSRATTVLRSLLAKAGIDPHRINASGFADTRPRVPNDTPQHRTTNRRVEIVVVVPPAPAATPPPTTAQAPTAPAGSAHPAAAQPAHAGTH